MSEVRTAAQGRRLRRGRAAWLSLLLLLLFIVPSGIAATGYMMARGEIPHWSAARSDSSGQAPDPATTPEAVVQVYAARAYDWRGIFGVHTWIAVKRRGAGAYERLEVLGWGVDRGRPAVRIGGRTPDAYWAGSRPMLLADLRGEGVDAVIDRIFEAARSYPYDHAYRLWPGPNSNTFVAYVARAVPELRLELPPTAIGKDYLPGGGLLASVPSGTGYQLSLYGLLGLTMAVEEGLEVNLLGLTAGIDLTPLALKLPGVGRVGVWRDQ